MKTRTDDKRPAALITGGSRGIGLALAWQFASQGHDVVLVARDGAALERAAQRLSAHGVRVTTHALDLTRPDAPAELFRRCVTEGSRIGILVNNAGVGPHGPLSEAHPRELEAMLALNVLALTRLTRLFLPSLIARGEGRILNVASLAAWFSRGPNWAAYVASKAYVLSFTRGLAAELRDAGVNVTALSPGATATAFVTDARVGRTRAYRLLPKVSTHKVAAAGYRALMKGRRSVVPGFWNKLLAFLGELPPRRLAETVFGYLLAAGRSRSTAGRVSDGRRSAAGLRSPLESVSAREPEGA